VNRNDDTLSAIEREFDIILGEPKKK
jgi:hypothetical protein